MNLASFAAYVMSILIAVGTGPLMLAVAVRIAGTFFGFPRSIAAGCIFVGMFLSYILIDFGGVADIWKAGARYVLMSGQFDPVTSIAKTWFSFLCDSRVWAISPLGLISGGTWLFLREDTLNSPQFRVFGADPQRLPSHWARIRGFFVKRSQAALVAGSITLGVVIATGAPFRMSLSSLQRHILVVGRSGRGKTVTILRIVRECARHGIPIVFLDGKGDFDVLQSLRGIAEAAGRRFYCLDASDPENSCAYDHFANKNITTQRDMIIQLREWSEDHFQGIASAHAQTVLKALSIGRMRADLHSFNQNLSVNSMLALARRGANKTGNYKRISAEIVSRRATEKAAVESLSSVTGALTESSFGPILDLQEASRANREILQMKAAREQNAIVYCGLPSLMFADAASRLGSLISADIKATLPSSRKQWLVVFDEFSVFANPVSVLNLVNMGRAYGASIVLATQTCADLVAKGDMPFLQQIFGSVNKYIVHEMTDAVDAEIMAGIFSTKPSVEFTAQIVDGRVTGSASSRLVHEFKVHPEQLKELGLGEAYVLDKDRPKEITLAKIIATPDQG